MTMSVDDLIEALNEQKKWHGNWVGALPVSGPPHDSKHKIDFTQSVVVIDARREKVYVNFPN